MPDRARRGCSPTGSPTCSRPAASSPTRSSRSRSPTRPRARCAGGSRTRSDAARRRSGSSPSTPPAGASCAARRERLGYRSNFTIYDQADQLRLVRECLEELGRDPKRFTPRGIHGQISNAKNLLIGPDEYAIRVASFYDQTVADVYGLYQRRLFGLNAVDFDDLLMLTVEVLARFPEAHERWAKAFRYVLVDEYQDTNHAQYALLNQLAGGHRNLMVVGDPDQSIYAFRGADIRNILEFERDFAGTRTIALEQNYRSTNAILGAANAVIAHNRERKEKRALVGARRRRARRRRRDRGRARRGPLRRRGGCPSRRERRRAWARSPSSTARTPRAACSRTCSCGPGVAYQVLGGVEVLRARRDQGRDRLPARDRQPLRQPSRWRASPTGLGAASGTPRSQRLQAFAAANGLSALGGGRPCRGGGLATASLRAVSGWRSLLQSLMAQALELSIAELIERGRRAHRVPAEPARRRCHAGRRRGRSRTWPSSSALRASTPMRRPEPTLSSFLQEISLFSDQDALREAESGGQVTLMTAHNAKGLEFRAVFMLGMEEGIFPHSRSLEENSRRGGAPALLRGDDACEGAADAAARRPPLALRAQRGQPALALPRRAARRGRVERTRLAPASWSGYGAPSPLRERRPARSRPRARDGRQRPPRDARGRHRHAHRGRTGVVTVRFEDGSERRLLLDYAPLEKVA